MSAFNKQIDKRQLFVTMGCALYPYARLKEILGDKKYNFKEFSRLKFQEDEKVVAIQELDYFSEPFMRMLAFRFAKSTCREVMSSLAEAEQKIVTEALCMIRDFLCGEETYTSIQSLNRKIRDYLECELYPKDHLEYKKQIGCFEILLSVTKWKAQESMSEASSIQRDMLGAEYATQQLKDIEQLALNLHDIQP